MITYDHVMPVATIAIAVGIAFAFCAFSYWRYVDKNLHTILICATRVLFYAVLVWCMLLPELRKSDIQSLKPRFVVALDISGSMKLSPSDDVPNRWANARSCLELDWTGRIANECELDIYPFGSDVGTKLTLDEARSVEPEGASTMLRDALKRITGRYAGQNVAGFVLLSDGLDTREAYDDWAAEAWPFSLYTVRLEPDGIWEVEPDVHVDAVNTPRRVTVNWKTKLKVAVSGQGTKGQPQMVHIFKNGKPLEQIPFQIPAGGGAQEVVFELENPEIGTFNYKVVVPPVPGEKNKEDNEYEVTVLVIDAKNRLLYVEGHPRWESKYLTRALKANKQAVPLGFIRGPGGKFISFGTRGSMTPDMRTDQLAFFKIVVVGNLDAEELGEERAKNLERFVDRGGSLVLLGGLKGWGEKGFLQTSLKKAMPIKSMTPKIMEGNFPVELTGEGRSHPAFAGDSELWDVIPPVLSIFPNAKLSPAAQALVIAQTPQGPQPLIVAQRYGQGKIAVILTDSLWKWKLTPESLENKPYQRFWDQLIQWLTPEKEKLDLKPLEIFADREQLYLGEEIELSARKSIQKGDAVFESEPVKCEIIGPDKRKLPFDMQKQQVMTSSGKSFPGYALKFTAEKAGIHRAVAVTRIDGQPVESDPVSFFVKPFTPESMPKPANITVLKMLASSSDGKYFDTPEEMNEFLQTLNFATKERESVEYESLWNKYWMLAVLMGLLTFGWVLRKTRNMP